MSSSSARSPANGKYHGLIGALTFGQYTVV
jgi:hypothetical protein